MLCVWDAGEMKSSSTTAGRRAPICTGTWLTAGVSANQDSRRYAPPQTKAVPDLHFPNPTVAGAVAVAQ